jgi:hypothetical protein
VRIALPAAVLVSVAALACVGSAAAVSTATPTLCTTAEVDGAVKRFLAAFNAGDSKALAAVWAAEPDFQWYSTTAPGARLRAKASDRASLIPYFRVRHAQAERLKLTAFRVNGNTGGKKPYGNFEFRLVRSARGLPSTDFHGKGALHCYAGRPDVLIAWSMTLDPT